MKYILIIYEYDTNEILVEPIKKGSVADMLRAYDVLYDTLENAGQATRLNIMDNGASAELTKLLQKIRTVVQLAPPHSHRRNSK